jgi:hypothetical protein
MRNSSLFFGAASFDEIFFFLYKEFYLNWNDSLDAVRSGKVWGALHIGPNFTDALRERRDVWQEVSNELLEESEISVSLDMSGKLILQCSKIDYCMEFFLRTSCGAIFEQGAAGQLQKIFKATFSRLQHICQTW